MFLVTTTQSLEVVLGGAVTSNQLHIYAAFSDHTTTSFTPSANSTVTNNTTAVTAVSAPGSSTQRQVNYFSIYNNDTVDAVVTVRINDNSTMRKIVVNTLKTGETLEYSYDGGWSVITSGGLIKKNTTLTTIKDTCSLPVGFLTGSITGVKTLGTNVTYAVWMGRADRSYTTATAQYRVTTAAVGITWAEIGIATGPTTIGGQGTASGLNLTTRGFTDVSGIINSTGIKTTAITISNIAVGDDLWFLIGNQIVTTNAIIRSSSNADNINSGRYLESGSSVRPSTMGAGTEFTNEGTAYAWVAVAFS